MKCKNCEDSIRNGPCGGGNNFHHEFCSVECMNEYRLYEAYNEIDKLRKTLELIMSMCGNPDAAEGCRNIIKESKKALGM